MPLNSPDLRPTEITVVVLLISLLLLLPPLLNLWITPATPWYVPYIVWLGIILLAYWLQRLLGKHAV